jgi:hypothetical protein
MRLLVRIFFFFNYLFIYFWLNFICLLYIGVNKHLSMMCNKYGLYLMRSIRILLNPCKLRLSYYTSVESALIPLIYILAFLL